VRDDIKRTEDDKLFVGTELDNLQFMEALKKIDEYAAELNQFIAEKQPWTLAKEGKNDEVTEVLNEAYTKLFPLASALAPFMPETAEKMNRQLETLEPSVLFPRLETKQNNE
jgi:methionyl-tRNA synthetase